MQNNNNNNDAPLDLSYLDNMMLNSTMVPNSVIERMSSNIEEMVLLLRQMANRNMRVPSNFSSGNFA
jgi:hypothetical protein